MKTIQSFTVDHDKLVPGLYISRKDKDAVTYDLRTRRPNGGEYMDHLTMHSVEHLMATFLRNGPHKDRIIYFGPMGCQTGFYLIVREMTPQEVKKEILRCLEKILAFSGEMPGGKRKECGNFQNLSLDAGKSECRRYWNVLKNKETDFCYEE